MTSKPTAAAAVAAALIAAFADTAPTGTGWWDLVLTASLAGAFVLAAVVGRVLLPVMFGAAVAAMFAGSTPALLVAVAGFAVGLTGYLRNNRPDQGTPAEGEAEQGENTPATAERFLAVAAALTVIALLHLRAVGFFALPSLIAGGFIGVVFLAGYRASPTRVQQAIRRAAIVVGAATAAALVLAALVGLPARSSANAGVDAARRGLASARAGDTEVLTAQLEEAEFELSAANDRLRSPLLKPLLLIPVVAQHQRSVSTAVQQGSIVAREAADVARDADVDELQLRQGQFDLDQLAAMAPLLEGAAASMASAVDTIERDRSPWLVPPIDDQIGSLVAEVVDVLPEAQLSAEAARILPGMLGAQEERRYLMLFGSPGEAREFGGFVGGYALIAINQGNLDLLEAGSVNDLLGRAREGTLDDPQGYPAEYLAVDPAFFPQNFTSTPNINLIARAVRDTFPTLAGAPIDGVIYADPFALAAMTEFTGPLSVDGVDKPLDSESLPAFIFEDQYRAFDTREERFSAIGRLAAATADGFEQIDLPGPERLGSVLGPVARAGRLQIVTYDDVENTFLTSVRLQRQFVAPTSVDSLAVIHTNGAMSKLDLYLHREIDYDVLVDDNGDLAATVDVRLRSEIPPDVPPLTFGQTDGTNRVLLSLYSRHELTSLSVDGRPHDYVVHEEFGFNRYALFTIPIAANESASVRFVLQGSPPPGDYRLVVWAQPIVHPDVVRITYRSPRTETKSEAREMLENWLFLAPE